MNLCGPAYHFRFILAPLYPKWAVSAVGRASQAPAPRRAPSPPREQPDARQPVQSSLELPAAPPPGVPAPKQQVHAAIIVCAAAFKKLRRSIRTRFISDHLQIEGINCEITISGGNVSTHRTTPPGRGCSLHLL